MKSILSASICAIALASAVPAMAATETTKPMHHHHMMGKHAKGRVGRHDNMSAKSGDSATADLNEKSLAAARGGSSDAMAPASSAPMSAPAPSSAMGPSGPMAPVPGTAGTTTPMNAPGVH